MGPLKALINDQFRRLEDLCQRSGIPVHKWHGDVSATAKKELRKNPTGVLLITPESIESLFINYPDYLDAMFRQLGFVVIDELHSFLGTGRPPLAKPAIPACSTKPITSSACCTVGHVRTSGRQANSLQLAFFS